ncbi:MAG: SDR family oxidoreductase, partial [Novosphingobium sp.]
MHAYGITKLGVRGITTALARELGPLGIRINAVAPGMIMTDVIRAELPATMVEHVLSQQVLGREGVPEDIVGAILYLTSPAASFVSGETLKVSGGFALGVG